MDRNGHPARRAAASASFREVTKEYISRDGSSVLAVDGASLHVEAGEFVSIVGPSGCGKSTLLKIAAGLLEPTAGEFEVDGEAVVGPRRDVGFVFQQPLLLPWKNVLDNVLLVAKIQRLHRGTTARRARELLELVGLAGFENKYPSELSGGMQQRVGVARALVNDPSLLLMDEPFGALDALTRERMGFELLRIWEQEHKTVVFVTHSLSEAVLLSDRVVCISARPGRILTTVAVALPRPRGLQHLRMPEFTGAVEQLREALFGDDVFAGTLGD